MDIELQSFFPCLASISPSALSYRRKNFYGSRAGYLEQAEPRIAFPGNLEPRQRDSIFSGTGL